MADQYPSHNRNRSGSALLSFPTTDDALRSSNPTSALLQDMLREKKAENRRLSRNLDSVPKRRDTSRQGTGERDIQSSPISSSASSREVNKHERRSSAMGGRITSATKGMGVREMEEHVSKLNKQNFDLKLELFHRRQRNETLEVEMEKMKKLEADNAELHSINDDLLRELQLRDVAVKEAVALICELEAKVEGAELQQLASDHGLEVDRPLGPHNTPKTLNGREQIRTPPPVEQLGDQLSPLRQARKYDVNNEVSAPSLGRTPSFLQEKKPSTTALRSVYQSDGNLSYISLSRAGSPNACNDPDSQTLNSPRLSMLSESSFVSVYGKSPRFFDEPEAALNKMEAPQDLTGGGLEIARIKTPRKLSSDRKECLPNYRSEGASRGRLDSTIGDQRQDRSKSRRDTSSDSTSNRSFKDRLEQLSLEQRSSTPRNREHDTSRWLDESVSADETSPLQQRTRRQRSSKSKRKATSSGADSTFSSIGEVLHESPSYNLESIPPLPTLGGPIFGGPNVLPPTPDTMTTQKAANSSTQSVVTERSLGDGARFPARNLSAMIPDHRPRTASTLDPDIELDTDDYDEERRWSQAAQSEAHTDAFTKESLQPSFPFMAGGSSSKAMQMMGGPPTRPPLTSYATNLMFDGYGVEDVQPSRGMSYPSPTGSHRRSVAYTPIRPEHARTASAQTQIASKDVVEKSTSNATKTTPSTPSPLKTNHLRSSSQHATANPSTKSKDSEAPEALIDSKIPRTVTSRFGLGSLKATFRRSTSQGATSLPPTSGGNETSNSGGQPSSRIARPGTSGSGGVASSFGGMKLGRSSSLRVKSPSGIRK